MTGTKGGDITKLNLTNFVSNRQKVTIISKGSTNRQVTSDLYLAIHVNIVSKNRRGTMVQSTVESGSW
jgi:hypothetical protein